MKRTMIVAAAALLIAGMTSPSFAHKTGRKHMHKKPVAAKTIDKKDEAKMIETKSAEPVAKMPTVTETKPVAAVPSKPSVIETMSYKATDMVKDKATDMVKDKAMDAATSGVKSAVNPTASVPSVSPTTAAAKVVPSSIPTTPNVAAPIVK